MSLTLPRVMDSFNKYVDDLIKEIRFIIDTNPDPEMAANKTKRVIQYWFKSCGKVKRRV